MVPLRHQVYNLLEFTRLRGLFQDVRQEKFQVYLGVVFLLGVSAKVAVFRRFVSKIETAWRSLPQVAFVQPADEGVPFRIVHKVEAFLVLDDLQCLSVVFVETKGHSNFANTQYLEVEVRGIKLLELHHELAKLEHLVVEYLQVTILYEINEVSF